ncbi:MAG: threonylcarbamoyl-AMP synthase [Bacteroidetes bacterium]|nr:threonylcarbamoyl-AMP synthase [Bacteroidota bacterium]
MARLGDSVAEAAQCLLKGELAGIPTETVYGLAANALQPEEVLKIYKAKNRPAFDPLIVHLSSASEMEKYAVEIPDMAWKLAREFWPGPLTLVLKKSPLIPDITTSGSNTVALRVPSHPLTLALLQQLPFPLAAPSANPFGYVSPTTAAHVQAQLGHAICYILNGGPCTVGLESTILDLSGAEPVLLRLGGLPREILETVTGKLTERLTQNSNPSAPGQLDSHYAPGCKINLYPFGSEPPLKLHQLRMFSVWPKAAMPQWILAPDGRTETAASALFAALRRLDEESIQEAEIEMAEETGLGRAINDRLRRAAAKR